MLIQEAHIDIFAEFIVTFIYFKVHRDVEIRRIEPW